MYAPNRGIRVGTQLFLGPFQFNNNITIIYYHYRAALRMASSRTRRVIVLNLVLYMIQGDRHNNIMYYNIKRVIIY